MTTLKKIVTFLDEELQITKFKDSSQNGLQVENSGKIRKICCGVDASMETFEAAQALGADLLICHHGLSWGDSLAHITDLNYQRIKFLIEHDMALYASHLPLDAHPRLGNNACIARKLGLRALKPFGNYNGMEIGFEGRLPKPVSYSALKKRVSGVTGSDLQTMDFGKKRVQTVAVVSGGAAGEIAEAGQKGIDVYVSGEPGLVAYSLAQEYGVNAIFAGHYATEVFGVRAVGEVLQKRFSVTAEFVDLNVPF
ncbi:MAG: Nif3-like dinuclear metal center hexameric protein [Verrucomicrobia bacterium]|jgi:dinuclear metal center YbgI/SA1388 family protein|nr:Nif3-like dinuclear metal center hexameric protein [Verrucomicrobiota bacterium]